MSTQEQGTLLSLDPDARTGRTARSGTSRASGGQRAEQAAAPEPAPAEATLSLEPLRIPIAAMVQSTLRAERELLEQIGADLRAELERLREWREREEAMRSEQTALYRQATEEWEAAGTKAAALGATCVELSTATRELRGTIGAAGTWFWHRATLAALLVALTGLGLIGGLCGVVWLALTQR